MKTNGSIYVAVVLAALTGYFVYQWWFNPDRMVKARLGDIAAVLSIPANEAELGRVTRLAHLRKLALACQSDGCRYWCQRSTYTIGVAKRPRRQPPPRMRNDARA